MFDFVRYANSFEDSDIIKDALDVTFEDSVLSICASGDIPLSLCRKKPKIIYAVDINDTQIYLLNLKIAAFKGLEYKELLEFLGVYQSLDRVKLFKKIEKYLDRDTKKYWNENIEKISKGVIHIGKFENYFNTFRKKVLPLIHTEERIEKMLSFDDLEEQKKWFLKNWLNLRWRILFKIFFGKRLMGKLGRDKAFFKYVDANVSKSVYKRSIIGVSNTLNKKNPYINYILRGNYTKESLPDYLKEKNYKEIRENVDRIKIFFGDVSKCLGKHKGEINKLYLSDIYEYMSDAEFEKNMKIIESDTKENSSIIYFNMLADRVIKSEWKFKVEEEKSKEAFLKDRAFFYKRVIIAKRRA